MPDSNPTPTISAVIGAYNAELFIKETLDAILGQTRPPDEVVVADDGSTDSTPEILASYGRAIRVIRQVNGGCPAAFNTAIRSATGDYVAICGADDVWEPNKLEMQAAALEAHPEIDVLFGGARVFGSVEGRWADAPNDGIVNRSALLEQLYRDNFICASSLVIRRSLTERMGPMTEHIGDRPDDWTRVMGSTPAGQRFGADDYDYWLRALRAGGVFHYDSRPHVAYRRHGEQATEDLLWIHRSTCAVHAWHGDMVDPAVLRSVRAGDLFHLGRLLIDLGRPDEARAALRAALRHERKPNALAWLMLLTLPARARTGLVPAFMTAKRTLSGATSS